MSMISERHQWQRDARGRVDDMAFTAIAETTEHYGPRCAVCGFTFCVNCYEAGWEHPCPGQPPRGTEFDWTEDASGHPPLILRLRQLRA